MLSIKSSLPTIGILPGWAVMEGKLPDRYLAAVLRSIQAGAREQRCHLLLAWGLGRVTDVIGLHPAWPVPSPDADFVPIGPWNTDGLIVFAPLRHKGHSAYLQSLSDSGFPVLFIATGERHPMVWPIMPAASTRPWTTWWRTATGALPILPATQATRATARRGWRPTTRRCAGMGSAAIRGWWWRAGTTSRAAMMRCG